MSIKRFSAEKARTRMCRSKKKKLKILTDHLWRRIDRAVESGKFRTETNGYFYDEGGTVPAELENQGEELMEELCQLAKEEFEKYLLAKHKDLLNNLTLVTSPNQKEGFVIQPKDGSYKLTFSDKVFEEFFYAYLKDYSKKLLFS